MLFIVINFNQKNLSKQALAKILDAANNYSKPTPLTPHKSH